MNQNVYQISCICQHKLDRKWEVFKFQRIYAKHFNVKNQMKSMFAKIRSTYCIIHHKIQMICLIDLQKLITVYIFISLIDMSIIGENVPRIPSRVILAPKTSSNWDALQCMCHLILFILFINNIYWWHQLTFF